MRIKILTPREIMPHKIPGLECECQNRPVDLSSEPAYITWLVVAGEYVRAGEPIVEGEVQKRVIMLPAPCDGILIEKCVEDGWETVCGEVIGYIDDGQQEAGIA